VGTLLFLIMYLVLMALVVFVPQVLRRFHVPAVVAIMLTGIIIGPNCCDLMGHLARWIGGAYSAQHLYIVIEALGLLGLVFLMSLAGMEVDVRMLTIEKKAVILLSILTFALPAAAGYGVYAMFRPDDEIGKWVYASLFASHSVGIVFPVIRELGVTRTRFGVSVLGATVVTDVLSLIMLAVAIQYKRLQVGSLGGQLASFSLFDRIDLSPLGNWFGVVFIAVIFVYMALCIWLIPAIWKRILTAFNPRDDVHVTFFLLAVLIVVTLGELIGVNLIVGAFIAGLAIVRAEGFEDRGGHLHHKLEGIGFGVMIPFLFLKIGMDSKPAVLLESGNNIAIATMTVVGLVGSKVFSGWLAMRLSGFSNAKGLCAGLMTVPQLSATLAAAAVALQLNMLDTNFFNAIIVLSMVTTIPVPTLVRYIIDKWNIKFVDAPGLERSTEIAHPQLVDEAINKTSYFQRLIRRHK
jgi:Kef-type K+ transport system membrane component KefB